MGTIASGNGFDCIGNSCVYVDFNK